MEPFVKVHGIAAALPLANVDTDVIMPKQFLKRIDRSGLAKGVFHDLRFDADGRERSDFVLNAAATKGARFLIVGANFGCGSSREYAVWGLMQYGVRAIIGTSFAGIFFDNCARNGLLALALPDTELQLLMRHATQAPGLQICVDLEAQRIDMPGTELPFQIDPGLRDQLLAGADAIDQTLALRDDILAFQQQHLAKSPWLG